MRNKFRFFMSLLLFLGTLETVSVSYAQDAKPLLFGFVNNQKIILSVPEGIKARKKIQEDVEKAQKAMQAKKVELEAINKEWDEKSELMSSEAKEKKRLEFQNKVMSLRDEEMNFQKDIREKELAATQEIVKKIATYVEEIAKKKGLSVVFEASQSGIMYMKDYVDITDDVILKFSEETAKTTSSATSTSKPAQK